MNQRPDPSRSDEPRIEAADPNGWPRDFSGYGQHPPDPKWPGNARIAVNFNLNFEVGGESNVLDGDKTSEGTLNDAGMSRKEGIRSPLVESAFEYGSRVGVWRLLRIFDRFKLPKARSRLR